MIARHVSLTFALFGAAGCAGTVPPPRHPAAVVRDTPPVALNGARISEVAFQRGLVWVHSAAGSLFAIEPQRGSAVAALPAEHVVGVHRTLDDRLWVLSSTALDVHVWERIEGGFRPLLQMAAPSSPLLALSDWGGRPVILARRAAFVVAGGGGIRSVPLDAEIEPGKVPHVAFAVTAAGAAYAGMNSGEWGGALYRIELSSGHVTALRRVDGSELCDGPLNPACDPITALIPDPDAPACVLVGVGLRHFSEHGRLLRVCGAEVSVFHVAGTEAPLPFPASGAVELGLAAFFGDMRTRRPPWIKAWPLSSLPACAGEPDGCPRVSFGEGSTPIFALSRTRRGFWMMTGAELYFVHAGRAILFDLPPLQPRGGVRVGWAPGVIATVTDANASSSLSGDTLVVAPTSLDGPDAGDDVAQFPWLRWLADDSPQGSCWLVDPSARDIPPEEERLFCFEQDHFFAKDRYAWLRGPLRWAHAASDTWIAQISDHESLRIRFARERAAATYISSYHREHVQLELVTGRRLVALQETIARLASR